MKRIFYSGIMAAAVFAAAADLRAQTNVYSLNVVSHFTFDSYHSWPIGLQKYRYELEEYRSGRYRCVRLIHNYSTSSTGSTTEYHYLAVINYDPFRVWLPTWLMTLISLPIVGLLGFAINRRKQNTKPSLECAE